MTAQPPPLPLRLTRIEYAARDIHLFTFAHPQGVPLVPYMPGAHIDLHLPGGWTRQYSLVDPLTTGQPCSSYLVAIKRDARSRGGSASAFEKLRVGDLVSVGGPRNHFVLDEVAPHSLLLAGGSGITPIACMVQRLRALGRPWTLHYSVRTRAEAALLDRLQGDGLHLHEDRIFKRPFSSPMAPRTRQTTALGVLESVLGGGAVCWALTPPPKIVLRRRRLRVLPGHQGTSTDLANPRAQPTPAARGSGSPGRSRVGSVRPPESLGHRLAPEGVPVPAAPGA